MPDLKLHFDGPFSLVDEATTLFKAPCAKDSGVYLWTVRQRSDGCHLIHYVGETSSFAGRHREHLVHILGLNYGVFDPDKAQEGISELVWRGLWREKDSDGPAKLIEAYGKVNQAVLRYLRIMSIFFAPVDGDSNLRKHIEGCIGWNLRNRHPEARALYPGDNHIGIHKGMSHGELLITSAEPIRGLDERIPY